MNKVKPNDTITEYNYKIIKSTNKFKFTNYF